MNVDDLARRPSVSDTGVPFLGVGLFWGIYGIVQLVVPVIGRSNLNLSLTLGTFGMMFSLLAVIGLLRLQQRIVERRPGYAAPAPMSPRDSAVPLSVMAGVVLVLIVAWIATDRRTIYSSGASLFAAVAALAVAVVAWEKKSPVGFYFAVYLIVLGVVLWWMRANFFQGLAWIAVGTGWPLATYGAILLRRFLRANPADTDE